MRRARVINNEFVQSNEWEPQRPRALPRAPLGASVKARACFGAVSYVRRHWVTKVQRCGLSGHWMHWAAVVGADGSTKMVHVSRRAFDAYRARGVKRKQDACRHPHSSAPPPTRTVRP